MTRRILGRSDFFCGGGWRFLLGFCGKRRFSCGVLLVSSWWFVVSLWFADGAFSWWEKVTGF
jgi:hypothetical protein